MTERADVIVIGAGLLGCFAARNLRRYALDVVVLEQADDVCTSVSKGNTGIVYAGYDMKPGTLKAEMTVRACEGFDELCRQLGVPFVRTGSLMTASGPRAEAVLRRKLEDGLANGVKGLELIDGAGVREMEPNLKDVTMALYAPQTGTVSPWELGIAAYENALANGAGFVFGSEVTGIERVPICRPVCAMAAFASSTYSFKVTTKTGVFEAPCVINCAGLSADRVREMCNEPSVRIRPDGADYLVIDDTEQGFVNHIVFQEPEAKGKGLTLVPLLTGNILVGPSEREGTESREATSREGLDWLREKCAEVVPGLDLESTIRSFGTSRPNPYHIDDPERSISNFTILEDQGMFSMIGIKTPGMTCTDELGKYATDLVVSYLENKGIKVRENPDYDPCRQGCPDPDAMDEDERALFIKEHPEYGRILCRCNNISEGQVLEAIRRGARSVEMVKRRAGTGMGRCQGGYCTLRIMELLERYARDDS